MAPGPAFELWWETDDGLDPGVWHLIALVPPDFPRDIETTCKLVDILQMTTQRAGGWKAVYTKMKDPTLPWFPDLNSEGHAVIWAALLRDYALDWKGG